MKKGVSVTEVSGEGLKSLMGEKVLIMCLNYHYAGTLTGVNKEDILLTDASIVYETGAWSDKSWKDAQKVGGDIYVRVDKIESYMKGK